EAAAPADQPVPAHPPAVSTVDVGEIVSPHLGLAPEAHVEFDLPAEYAVPAAVAPAVPALEAPPAAAADVPHEPVSREAAEAAGAPVGPAAGETVPEQGQEAPPV